MSSENEALGRLVIAEFEARRKADKAYARAARMRFAVQVVGSIGLVAIAVIVVRQRIVFDSRDWAFLACTVLLVSGWSNYRLRERVTELRSELDRLKAALDDKKA